jgi:mannose-6-phosphate isomerase-like protein (cupin superfamily)
MTVRKAAKINPHDVTPIVLKHRTNYKLVDPTTVGSERLTFGMVVVEPGGICEPGHSHEVQEEIFFCVSGNGIVIVNEPHEEWPVGPLDAVYFPPHTYHCLRNPHNTPLTMLWIMSPAGWVFDQKPDWKDKAEKGEKLEG